MAEERHGLPEVFTALSVALTLLACGRATQPGLQQRAIVPAPTVATARATIFVDLRLPTRKCTNYDPIERTCGGGSATAFSSLAAVSGLVPGDVVALRAGTYGETLRPAASGAPGKPLTYTRHASEVARISRADLNPAIDLSNASHVIIDGLVVEDVAGWLRAENTRGCVVRNSTFRRATADGSRAGLKFIRAEHNKILDNVIADGNDNLLLIDSHRNVVAGNTFGNARHGQWSILCGSYNVIRGNVQRNEVQKIGQITDCEGEPSDTPVRFDATKRNLVEDNVFAFVPSAGNHSPYSGIQYSAQHGIVRRNRFHDLVGGGLQMTLYDREARHNTDNRIYHNVFYAMQHAGVVLAPGADLGGNVFKNNVLAASVFVANDRRWPWYAGVLAGQPVQILTARRDGFSFESNDIFGRAPGDRFVISFGRRDRPDNPEPHDLAWWQKTEPTLFARNLEVEPGFVDPAARNFHLRPASALVDAGTFLTRTRSAGSGTTLAVEDVLYFYDGFGIEGESGDLIQLEGRDETACIVSIDEHLGTLTVDRPLSWTAGQGVALAFAGRAPDIGAYELGH